MSTLHSTLSFLALFSLFLSPTTALQPSNLPGSTSDEYWGPDGTAYNASASYPIPGFYPPGTGTNTPSNWTYNTAVFVGQEDGYRQTIWIETSDGTDVGSKGLPYLGCVAAFFGLPHDTITRGQKDTGDCTTTFDQQCVMDLVQNAKSGAAQYSGTNKVATEACIALTRSTVSKSCTKFIGGDTWKSSVASPAIGNRTPPNTTDSVTYNVTTEGANNGFLTWTKDYKDNATAYDEALTSITPIITTAWLKGNGTDSSRNSDKGNGGWSDARLGIGAREGAVVGCGDDVVAWACM
ncbi:MAG: hypothetical protein Q9201_007925, partial [Fulgogasparrea decipioides]